MVQLYPDADQPPDALCLAFWKLLGHKHLIHDGKRLVLVARWPNCCLRFVLAPGLAEGMAYAYAVRPRPPLSALLELHTLQALDATLVGASLREVAEGLFGADARRLSQ